MRMFSSQVDAFFLMECVLKMAFLKHTDVLLNTEIPVMDLNYDQMG